MAISDIVFNKDIVLDQEAFKIASSDLKLLSANMKNLKSEIEKTLSTLEAGFDTPAGVKFISSCKNNLLDPLNDQVKVIEHVSDNLNLAKENYNSVFIEYEKLNSEINNT